MARPRVHDDALRTLLLDVTSEVLTTSGPAAVTVRDVARRAGTSSSAVYALLGSKEALLAAVVDEGFRRFARHLAEVPRTESPEADLLALGLAYRRSALADPHFYRVMFGGAIVDGTVEPEPATHRGTFLALQDAVARVLTHRGRATDGALEAAVGLWALVHGLVSLELAGLLPGDPADHAARYERRLRAAGAVAFA